ncbi:lysozyme inhibitor LprI family protein [uncultured Sphingomonas sp.]|uniref:lysozyme inhibitor LprI family protein n=1 Tax=uncultured Sphingomonas sp. TaxID=158754 RepID=UPI0035CB5CD7
MLMIALLLAAAAPVGPAQADAEAQAGTDYAAADAAMTVQYRAAMARMRTRDAPAPPGVPVPPSFANSLLQAQRAWLPFRDSECLAEAFAYRGQAPAVVDTQCKTRLTVERTRQLRAFAQ